MQKRANFCAKYRAFLYKKLSYVILHKNQNNRMVKLLYFIWDIAKKAFIVYYICR